jgi:penicillin-binding protein 1A
MKQAVTAMSTFPLGGRRGAEIFSYIDRIENSEGRVVYRRKPSANPSGRLLDSAVAWQVHSMMAGGMTDGSAGGLADSLLEKPFRGAAKGGTTHDFTDTWFLGYNGRVTCGVWTGFLQGNSEPIYPGAFSRDLSMPVWTAAMNAAAPAFGGKGIDRPVSLSEVEICSVSGQRATQFCQEMVEDVSTGTVRSKSTKIAEYFREGVQNLPFCTHHSGAMAGDADPSYELGSMPAVDALPVLPKSPVLIGEDPFHSELPSYTGGGGRAGFMSRSTNVLDSLDLGDFDDTIRMSKPPRLEIQPD